MHRTWIAIVDASRARLFRQAPRAFLRDELTGDDLTGDDLTGDDLTGDEVRGALVKLPTPPIGEQRSGQRSSYGSVPS
jgi:hypothetical protein